MCSLSHRITKQTAGKGCTKITSQAETRAEAKLNQTGSSTLKATNALLLCLELQIFTWFPRNFLLQVSTQISSQVPSSPLVEVLKAKTNARVSVMSSDGRVQCAQVSFGEQASVETMGAVPGTCEFHPDVQKQGVFETFRTALFSRGHLRGRHLEIGCCPHDTDGDTSEACHPI